MDERHHNKNFASLFPIWDIVFGTAYFPNDAEPIRTGLHDKRGPRSVREYLFALAARDALRGNGACECPRGHRRLARDAPGGATAAESGAFHHRPTSRSAALNREPFS